MLIIKYDTENNTLRLLPEKRQNCEYVTGKKFLFRIIREGGWTSKSGKKRTENLRFGI